MVILAKETFLVQNNLTNGMESSVLGLYYYGRSFLSNEKIWTSLRFLKANQKETQVQTP
jgi:hypothetical protein